MQKCPHCQVLNRDTAKFCRGCGQRLPRQQPGGKMLQGRYRILKELGRGGMGAIFEAKDARLGNRRVAVKENFDTARDAQRQFKLEAQMLATLGHPNLPRVIDHFIEPSGRQYLVMDFVQGQDLGEIIEQQGPLTESQALQWFEQVCDALSYMHAQAKPVIHRDIKPANIRITPAGNAMLVDFGIAKQQTAGQKTQIGARAVTSGYSPPEQYGLGTDARSDIYALGATLYSTLTAMAPPDAMDRLNGVPLPKPRRYNRNISSATEETILHALELDPDRRPQTIQELLQRLGKQQHAPVIAPVKQPPLPLIQPIPPLVGPLTPTPVAIPPPVSITVPQDYASWGRRCVAAIIDSVVISFVLLIITMPCSLLATVIQEGGDDSLAVIILLSLYAVGILVYLGYFTYFHTRSGQTPGKKILAIQVIGTDGSNLTKKRAFTRSLIFLFAGFLSYFLIGLLDYLWPLWDRNNQALHDKAANSYVIKL